MKTYDVLVLGGGTAGSAAAKAAHAAGARTAMFNDGELGGLCILRGCMPTKTMLHAAHLVHHARWHGTSGVRVGDVQVDFGAVMANKDAKVERFQRAKIEGIEAAGFDVIDARACFTGPDTVEAGGESYRFTRGAVIATGSVPAVPDVAGLAEVGFWTSDDVMRLTAQPASVIIVGSGAIGLELAQFFSRIGAPVELVSRRPLCSRIDEQISEEMHAVMRDEPGLEVVCPARPVRVSRAGGAVVMQVDGASGAQELTAEALVMATGRRAAVEHLRLQAAGVELDGRAIRCGADMRTTNRNVFVAGDASGLELLLHVANQEGLVAGLGAARAPGIHEVDRRLKMAVVFTDPAVATVGLSEAEARAQGIPIVTAVERFPETGRAITMDVRHGVWKLVAAAPTGEILGTQILGPRADDLVHTVAVAMYHRATVADLLDMPWYHPTLSEVLISLARDLQRQVERATEPGIGV